MRAKSIIRVFLIIGLIWGFLFAPVKVFAKPYKLHILLDSESTNLLPFKAKTSQERLLAGLTHDTLFALGADNKLIPRLAKKVVISKGGLKATVFLKKNLMFCDGYPLEAGHVKDSIYRVIQRSDRKRIYSMARVIDQCEVIDKYTLSIELKCDLYSMEEILSDVRFAPCSPVLTSAFKGAGPYVLVRKVKSQGFLMRPNPLHWDFNSKKLPIVCLFKEDKAVEGVGFSKQDYDLRMDLTYQKSCELKEKGLGNLAYLGPKKNVLLLFNLRKNRWKNKEVRNAFTLALSKAKIAQGLTDAASYNCLFDRYYQMAVQANSAKSDKQKAKTLLLKHGFAIKKPIVIGFYQKNSTLRSVLKKITDEFKVLGVKAVIREIPHKYFNLTMRQAKARFEFDMFLLECESFGVGCESCLWPVWAFSHKIWGFGPENEDLLLALKAICLVKNKARQKDWLAYLHKKVQEKASFIWLFNYKTHVVLFEKCKAKLPYVLKRLFQENRHDLAKIKK